MSAPTVTPAAALQEPKEKMSVAPILYAGALPDEQRRLLKKACEVRGLEAEIALLRFEIYLLLENKDHTTKPAALQIIARLVDLLIKAQRAQGSNAEPDQAMLDTLMDTAVTEALATARKLAK
jgi:hypothetical protein